MSSRYHTPSPYCQVLQCRYSNTHTTKGHCCGRCGIYGHGEIECLQPWRKITLEQYYNDVLPEDQLCTVDDCIFKQLHTTAAHHCPACKARSTHTVAECPITLSIQRTITQLPSQSTSKTINCPICRTENTIENPKKIFGLNDTCSICLDNNVEILLPECSHCCICKVCYEKM